MSFSAVASFITDTGKENISSYFLPLEKAIRKLPGHADAYLTVDLDVHECMSFLRNIGNDLRIFVQVFC